jgi:replication-associated recombination protein RarA
MKDRHDLMPHIASDSFRHHSINEHLPLYHKYRPNTLSEIIGHTDSICKVKQFLSSSQSLMGCIGSPGIGITSTVDLIVKDMGMTAKHLSCSSGFTDVTKVLKTNLKNVLFALQQIKTNIVYIIKDFDALNRSDKVTIVKLLIEIKHAHSIVISPVSISSVMCVHFTRPSNNEILKHLYWIVCEENIDISDDRLQQVSSFQDVRTCINAIESPHICDRDAYIVEPYLTCLYTHETMKGSLNDVSTMLDLLCDMDSAEFKPTREWFAEVTSEFCTAHFDVGTKQTYIARNAQICNRTRQLSDACNNININVKDMDLYATLMKLCILNGSIRPFPESHPNYLKKNRSIYIIAKRQCKVSESKMLKSILKC